MTEIRNYDTVDEVAKAAAENAVEILNLAIAANGSATWVLAGGSSPVKAYLYLVKHHSDMVDWSKVTVLMGDERVVPMTDPNSNWGQIMKIFGSNSAFESMVRIAPTVLETTDSTAASYNDAVKANVKNRFDLVWLGVGEDGHTLSLFPGNSAFTTPTEDLVVPVYDSPKPPLERISFSLKALEHVSELVIFATGASKKDILRTARLKGGMPVSVAAEVAEMNGAEVRWLYDNGAWGER